MFISVDVLQKDLINMALIEARRGGFIYVQDGNQNSSGFQSAAVFCTPAGPGPGAFRIGHRPQKTRKFSGLRRENQ